VIVERGKGGHMFFGQVTSGGELGKVDVLSWGGGKKTRPTTKMSVNG